MNNIIVLLQKEWLEFKQQRGLILGIIALPLLRIGSPPHWPCGSSSLRSSRSSRSRSNSTVIYSPS